MTLTFPRWIYSEDGAAAAEKIATIIKHTDPGTELVQQCAKELYEKWASAVINENGETKEARQ